MTFSVTFYQFGTKFSEVHEYQFQESGNLTRTGVADDKAFMKMLNSANETVLLHAIDIFNCCVKIIC